MKNRPSKRFFHTLIAVVVFFIAAEGLCRLFNIPERVRISILDHVQKTDGAIFHNYNQEDPYLMWSPIPNFSHTIYQINSMGIRDTLRPFKKEKNVFRILCLGDSSTFGQGVELQQIYHKQLEKRLNEELGKDDCRVEVINCGVVGYSSLQGLLMYERFGRKFQPDVVSAYFGINDTNCAYYMSDKQILTLNGPIFIKDFKASFLHRSAFYKSLRGLFLSPREMQAGEKVNRVSLSDYQKNLLQLRDEVQADGASFVLISPAYVENSNPVLEWIPHLHRFAKSNEIPIVVSEKMTATPKQEASRLFLDNVHPTPEGHKILAQRMYACLKNNGMLPTEGFCKGKK